MVFLGSLNDFVLVFFLLLLFFEKVIWSRALTECIFSAKKKLKGKFSLISVWLYVSVHRILQPVYRTHRFSLTHQSELTDSHPFWNERNNHHIQ